MKKKYKKTERLDCVFCHKKIKDHLRCDICEILLHTKEYPCKQCKIAHSLTQNGKRCKQCLEEKKVVKININEE